MDVDELENPHTEAQEFLKGTGPPQASGFPMKPSWGPPAPAFPAPGAFPGHANGFNPSWQVGPQGVPGLPPSWGGSGGGRGGGRPPLPSSLPQKPTGLPPRPGLQPPGFSNGPRRMDRGLSQSSDTGGLNYD